MPAGCGNRDSNPISTEIQNKLPAQITCYYNIARHFVAQLSSIILQYLVNPVEVNSNPSSCQIKFEQMNANCNRHDNE